MIDTKYINLMNVLEQYKEEVIRVYKNKITDNDINASYQLMNSIQGQIQVQNQLFQVSLNLAKHWEYVEYGRKAGKWPNIQAIRQWISVKPVLPRPINGKLPTPQALTFLISRAIKDRGIKPKPILATTITEVNETYIPLILEALKTDLNTNINAIIKTGLNANYKTITLK